MTRKYSLRAKVGILVLASAGVALVAGVPLGVVVALNTWLEWVVWAVPLIVGVVTFAVGATFLLNDQPGPQ